MNVDVFCVSLNQVYVAKTPVLDLLKEISIMRRMASSTFPEQIAQPKAFHKTFTDPLDFRQQLANKNL